MRLKHIYLFLTVLLLVSCHKDLANESENTIETTQITVPLEFKEIEGTLIGYVYGEDNLPIADAEVSIYSATTSTNEYGIFELADVKMDGQGTSVQVKKQGYIDGFDYVFPNDNGSGTARLKLKKFTLSGAFNSDLGGQVLYGESGSISFPENSIVMSNGSAYSGEVSVNIIHAGLDNNDEMVGGFIGLDAQGRNAVLSSYGTVEVSLLSDDNDVLQIKTGNFYTVKFPISQDLIQQASDEISVWRFDVSQGFWVEEGVAVKEGGFYLFQTNSLDPLIFADAHMLAHFCGRLVDNSDNPLQNCLFNFYVEGRLCGSGISDNDGFICSKLPNNVSLELQIIHPFCIQEVGLIDIDPIVNVVNVGDIHIDIDNDLREGRVTCNDAPVPNAMIVIQNEVNTVMQIANDQGFFNVNLTSLLCNHEDDVSLFAISGMDKSPAVELSIGSLEPVQLETCDSECSFLVSVEKMKNDFCSSGVYDVLDVETEGGSGQFSYLWNDGSTDATITSISSTEASCVTVTDLSSGCSVVHCEPVSLYERLAISDVIAFHNTCEQDGGQLEAEVVGGVGPYTYKWSGEGGFVSSEISPSNLMPGLYSLTVVDANDCESYGEQIVINVNLPVMVDLIEDCGFSTIIINEDSGYTPYIYEWSSGESTTNELFVSESGMYSVTITDQIGCERIQSIDVVSVGIILEINTFFECENERVIFYDISSDYSYFYESILDGSRVDLDIDIDHLNVSVLETGYSFLLGGLDLNSNCEILELVELPHFEGLEVTVSDTSCEECNDGFVSVFLNNNQECTGGCNTGEVIIIDKLTSEDVSELNNQSSMSSGVYVVIVIDELNGCYIAHEEIEIE